MKSSASRISFAVFILIAVYILIGCATVFQAPPPSRTPLGARDTVLILKEELPQEIEYEVLGEIYVGKAFYGGSEWALQKLAEQARLCGANVVHRTSISFTPRALAWAAPHGRGQAVRVKSISVEEIPRIYPGLTFKLR